VRIYDCNPLLREASFRVLENEAFFRAVRADDHGYGVVWDDKVDLAESELWLHGKTEPVAPADPKSAREFFGYLKLCKRFLGR